MKAKTVILLFLPIFLTLNLLGCDKNTNTTPPKLPATSNPSISPVSSQPSISPITSPSATLSKEIPKKTTVYIRGGQGIGSGIIIGRSGKTYYVLTARHVVGIPPGKIEDKYKISLPDGKRQQIDYDKQITKDDKLDLAIIKFQSDENYQFASLNDNLSSGEDVFIFGWKDCTGNPKSEFTKGKIKKVSHSFDDLSKSDLKTSDNPQEDYQQGYRVKYTNPTITGMSGSAVFNQNGEVVAIHGKPGEDKNNQYDFKKCTSLNQSYSPNWGISIQAFLNSKLSQNIHYNLVNTPTKNSPSSDNNPTPNSTESPHYNPFKTPDS